MPTLRDSSLAGVAARLNSGPSRLIRRLSWRTADSRTAAAARVAAVPVLVLVILLWLVASVLRSGSATGPALYAEFVDSSTSMYLDVQLDARTRSYGAFSVVVPQLGRVWPAKRVTTSRGSGGEVWLHYDGVGHLDPRPRPSNDDEPGVRRVSEKVRLRLTGSVDPDRHTASVDLQVNNDAPLHIESSGRPGGADAVVDEFVSAVRHRDWNALYDVETVSMHNGSSRKDLVTAMPYAGAITNVRGIRTTGPTRVSSSAGVSYARTPIRLIYTTGANSTPTAVDATLVLALNGGTWGVLGVE